MQRTTNYTTSACSSCKHQRKKCTDKCILAPFFPVTKTIEFQAVHKVFGVSNVTKIVRNLKEEDRKIAVDSLVWEALCRQKDPVLGPYGDYRRVCEELRLYKNQFRQVPITQGSLVYKPTQGGLTGWNDKVVASNNDDNNNNNNFNDIDNNNSMNNIHINGDSMMDFYPFSYNDSEHNIQESNKFIIRPERQNDSSLNILPQQYLSNGFNQQYFLTGKYNPMDSKSMESTLWEGSC